jgi:2-dehydro-3-deoxy-D-gluconate 5-dehydrogenase
VVKVKPISDFSMDLFKLNGKAAIVTGASTGLGQAYAVALAKAGADLLIVDLNPPDETRELILKEGRKVICLEADVTVKENIDNIVRSCVKTYGKIDILVNNAGVMKPAPILEFTEENWKRTLEIHINTAFYLSQAAARIMVPQRSGKIINIGSMFSFQGATGAAAYATAKSGVLGLTRALAVELAKHNIQVNALCPGWILTASGMGMFGEDKELAASIPSQRCGDPFDCMGPMIFLASNASDYVTGIAMPADGGFLVAGY